jgi:hypothetical protein
MKEANTWCLCWQALGRYSFKERYIFLVPRLNQKIWK